jgi:general secretion pathway protein G
MGFDCESRPDGGVVRAASTPGRTGRKSAFTVIETLVLAIIVGVLAATIIPQFSQSAREAKMSNLKFNLRIMRSRLETYKEEHAGVYPPAADSAGFSDQMTQRSNRNAAPNSASGACGPYLEGSLPVNPFNGSSSVAILQGDAEPNAATGSDDGWQYNAKHGWFYPNNNEYFQTPSGFASPN